MTDHNQYLDIVQQNLKSVLSIMIIINFCVIFLLRYSIKLKDKLASFYELKKEDLQKQLESQKEILIITAHPDDEIMFFSPTIIYLLRFKCKIRILCFSNGNYIGEGKIREKEMENLCNHLNIPYTLINHDKIKDNINIKWDTSLISEILTEYLIDKNIGTFITFDENGITSHPNHISIYEGLIYYLKENREVIKEKKIRTYILDTYNYILQYTLIIPAIIFYFKEYGFFNLKYSIPYSLMKFHKSQFNINRKLHSIFSSYSYFNTYTRIELN